MPWCYLCSTFISNQIVLTTMKQMLNRMLRYADAIVKRGVDKLKTQKHPSSKNACAMTLTAQRKQLTTPRTAV